MTLHDRIMDLSKGVFAGPEYSMGYEAACETASEIAKEADELMAEMADVITGLMGAIGDWERGMAEECANCALAKYNTYKERNNEQ